jgi:hypothetical protein
MTLDPEVRDLLRAIDHALDAPADNRPAIRAAIRSTLQHGGPAEAAAWLLEDEETVAASDAARVHAADLHERYVAWGSA